MATLGSSLTRSSSSDSSALSNILVAAAAAAHQEEMDESASEGQAPASTPPTSLEDTASSGSVKPAVGRTLDLIEEDAAEEESVHSGRRPKRVRSGVSTYNLKKLSDQQEFGGEGSRNVSGLTGKTLVEGEQLGEEEGKAEAMDWESTSEAKGKAPAKLQRRPSVKDRVKNVGKKVGAAMGKRKRDVVEAGKKALGMRKEEPVVSPKKSKVLKELDMGTRGVLDEMDLDEEYAAPPPAKRARLSEKVVPGSSTPLVPTHPTAPPGRASYGPLHKTWQKEGLYVGQEANFESGQIAGGRKKLQKKSRPGSSDSADATTSDMPVQKKRAFMPLPMFAYLDKTRDFIIPYDIYNPETKKGTEKPKDWHKVNRNKLVGEAKGLWAKVEKLPPSVCTCPPPGPGEMSCEEDCLNRVMQYECNDDNCPLSADECSNRAFGELAARTKKGGAFDVGVEVLRTKQCGFGVRSCRAFAPGQIIMEYTGEIISEGECQRRMREEYKDKQCYYLMELERGLIIDGTKGSMARFINHCCEPNCEVRMVKVNGIPRMAVFAGEWGVVTGDELTYDYNFDNFGTTIQKCYCRAPSCRGFLSKRLNATEMKKLAKQEEEKRARAAEEAREAAQRAAQRKLEKGERGSGWRGWVAVDDPETRERLREEKRAREEAEKNSSRARRMAARRGSMPAEGVKEAQELDESAGPERKKRRKTAPVKIHQEVAAPNDVDDNAAAGAEQQPSVQGQPHALEVEDRRDGPLGNTSPSQEAALTPAPRPVSARTTTSTITKKTSVSIETTTEVLQSNAVALTPKPSPSDATAEAEEDVPKTKGKAKEGLSRKDSVKKTFVSLFEREGSSKGKGYRQTTLSFGAKSS